MPQKTIEPLHTVLPGEIPTDHVITEWLLKNKQVEIGGRSIAARGEILTNLIVAQELRKVLGQIPNTEEFVFKLEGESDDLAHDEYFHVRRTQQKDAATVLVRAIISARLTLLEEVEKSNVTIDHEELGRIDRGFVDLIACLNGEEVGSRKAIRVWETGSNWCDAKQRWVHGHHIFIVLTQGLILALRSLGQGLRTGAREQIRRWSDLAISLLNASAAALSFTGDFEPGEYESTIRPSMMPPLAPMALSGLMSADHRFMAQTIRDMRPALQSLAEQDHERHEAMAGAIAAVYDSHIHVCERFVGLRPSLLTAGRTDRSGPSLIEQFKTLRLKPFEHSQRAERLKSDQASVTLGECPFKH